MSLALLADAPCADCGALLEEGQRYCVHCGRRRTEVDDPAITWLADQRASVGAERVGPAAIPARNPLALPAVSFALLPLAVAVGVLVGHHGNSGASQEQLLAALRSQKAPVVNVNGGGTAAASSSAPASANGSAKAGRKDATGAKVVAKTRYGVAHQITGFKPTTAKVQSDKKLVQQINKSIGKNYLQAQKNLPDTIVVTPGSGSTNSAGAHGRGD